MPDEVKEPTQQDQQDPNQNYIETIKNLRENTVSKEEYQRVLKDNKQLLETLMSGGQVETPKPGKEEIDKSITDLRKQIKTGDNMTNLEFTQAALKLRQQVLERDGKDIFVSPGKKYSPTKDDYEAAQRVADIFQECVDEAEGDPSIFTNAITRRLRG